MKEVPGVMALPSKEGRGGMSAVLASAPISAAISRRTCSGGQPASAVCSQGQPQ
jgi:hypothetical protein